MASSPAFLPTQTDPVYRRITEKDLLAGKDVPGTDPDDPIVQLLRVGLPTKVARTAFGMARREGFLQVDLGYGLYPDARVVAQLEEVWCIWCAVRAHPPITLTVLPDGEGRLECDLAPVELGWSDRQTATIGRLLEMTRPRPGYRWTLTTTSLEVEGLEAGGAVAMARGLVWVVRGGWYRAQGVGQSTVQNEC
jgi:hypothetical protein